MTEGGLTRLRLKQQLYSDHASEQKSGGAKRPRPQTRMKKADVQQCASGGGMCAERFSMVLKASL